MYYSAKIVYEGIEYPSAEQAYHAAKTLDIEKRKLISKLPHPSLARKYSKHNKVRDDWNQIKELVLTEQTLYKFSHSECLKKKLLDTGHLLLIHNNHWHDMYFGVYNGRGLNKYGIILMNVREALRRQ